MGKLIYSMITSIDGYVADQNGNFDWAMPSEEALDVINQQTANVGTYLYGRAMYDMMHVWETDPAVAEQSPLSQEFAKLWQNTDKVVYSTTLQETKTAHTRIVREFHADDVAHLKSTSDRDLTVDGPTLASHALGHGLVDEISLLLCPVVVGGGLAFLPDIRLDLRLKDERRFANGMVWVNYDVV